MGCWQLSPSENRHFVSLCHRPATSDMHVVLLERTYAHFGALPVTSFAASHLIVITCVEHLSDAARVCGGTRYVDIDRIVAADRCHNQGRQRSLHQGTP
jgi:hypothetical protein